MNKKTGTSMNGPIINTRHKYHNQIQHKNNTKKKKQASICKACPHYDTYLNKCTKFDCKTYTVYSICTKTKKIN